MTRSEANGNAGSAADRRRRKEWLLETYRADLDLPKPEQNRLPRTEREAEAFFYLVSVPFGQGVAACRCYRCGELLTFETLTVDRIIPGCQGGTYRRTNIRPACKPCQDSQGGKLRHG